MLFRMLDVHVLMDGKEINAKQVYISITLYAIIHNDAGHTIM